MDWTALGRLSCGAMRTTYGDEALEPTDGTIVTVGVFDGVHIGHRGILAEARRLADDENLRVVAVVLDRHPNTILDPEHLPPLLTDLQFRLELLEGAGVDVAHVLRFDEVQSLQSAEDFVAEVLIRQLCATAQIGGEDFHFGHRRRGDAATLADVGASHGLKVVTVPLVRADDEHAVSSTRIRELVRSGATESAARLLGRAHEVRGVVEHGDARGRAIGFPTANVAVPGSIALPADGVYAGWYVDPDGVAHASAINIGRRPTFYDENGLLLVEAHLIDFDGDLYGQHAGVRVGRRLRDEIRFSGIDALTDQLRIDVEAARAALK